jgi:energy-coupling factor transporter ATP-binding protein EcfA2
MLHKVAVLNSKVYGKAEIKLDDCESLQLVGPNNIGKSTLIYALNFLFIVDGQKMSFSGQRKGDKETIHHYFPTPNQSYIIFEVFKKDYFCILVKRDSEGDLEYFRFEGPYREELFFVRENGAQRIMKFDEVKQRWEQEGIAYSQFRNKTEVFQTVYQRGRDNNAVVWLEDNVKTDGLSNNFSKVYRYLINSKLITNKSLKNALIIADNRENEGINFSQKNKKDIVDLLRINDEIKAVKEVRSDFLSFREVVNLYNSRTRNLSELVYAFRKNWESAIPHLEGHRVELEKTIAGFQTELNEVLKPQRDDFNQKIGKKDSEMGFQVGLVQARKEEIESIRKFENLAYQREALANLDAKRKEVEARITTIEHQKLSSAILQHQINGAANTISRLKNQIKNYNDLLIHKIATKAEHRKFLNAILSDQVTSLPGSAVKKKVKSIGDLLPIFDGEIDLSKGIEQKDFKTVEELKADLSFQESEKKRLEVLYATALDMEKATADLNGLKEDIRQVEEKIRRIQELPSLEKSLKQLDKKLIELKAERDELQKGLKDLTRQIAKLETKLDDAQEERRKLETRLTELQERKEEIEFIDVEPIAFNTEDDLETIYNKIRVQQSDRSELKANKDRMFDTLRNKLRSTAADEMQFIRFVEDEFACLHDKEKSIDGLLASISTQFANPAYTLMKRYEEFKQFVQTKFNPKLAGTRISDIESLTVDLLDNKKILYELKKISSIQEINGQMMLEFDQSENLKILNSYLDAGRKINFEELFDIDLRITIKGQEKVVDLANQVESDGTDRMIRLVIVMSVINRLAVNDEDNRIALFIDEVATIDKQNRPELVKFCRDHHFIPIFAAPDPVPGFHKYYFIYPGKGKIVINENVNTLFSEKVGSSVELA